VDEDEYIFTQEVEEGTPRDYTLAALIPRIDDDEVRKRYLKYKFYAVRTHTYAQVHGLEEDEQIKKIVLENVRPMTQEEVKRHRHALKAGSLTPSKQRPPGAMIASKVHFAGPVVRRDRDAKIPGGKHDPGVPVAGDKGDAPAGGLTEHKGPVLQRKRVAVPLPDFRPKAPKPPDKVGSCLAYVTVHAFCGFII
jgi:hypothetical protein